MFNFSISTSWNAMNAPNVRYMLNQIKEAGFGKIELNFGLTANDVNDIIRIKERGLIEVTSLHNFCPIPRGATPAKASPDYYSLSSTNEKERRRAVAATKVTIDTARSLGAKAVVLHLGRVNVKDRTRKLGAALDDLANYGRIKKRMVEERAQKANGHIEKVLLSMEELLGFAKHKNIILGIETRYYYNEVPSLEEIGIILDRFKDDSLGYWHDTGHAQILENIGLYRHRDFLDRYSGRIVGMHIHDVTGTDDHRAPLQGSMDFSILIPYIKRETILVLEPHFPAEAEDITEGARYLEDLFSETLYGSKKTVGCGTVL